MKILNLFAGIGGNRAQWGDTHQIDAVEDDESIADLYMDRFPNDNMVIGDAYNYVVLFYEEYDFIWASPPCQTHSKLMFCQPHEKRSLPDLRLYSLILFLNAFFKGKWVVENVAGYYKPLIKNNLKKLGRHYIWSNFPINDREFKRKYSHQESDIAKLKEEYSCQDVPLFKGMKERQILRNCVLPEMGKYILDSIKNKTILEYVRETRTSRKKNVL